MYISGKVIALNANPEYDGDLISQGLGIVLLYDPELMRDIIPDCKALSPG